MKEKCYKKNNQEKKILKMKFLIELKLLQRQKKLLKNLLKKKEKKLKKIKNQNYKQHRLKQYSIKLNKRNDTVP